MNLVDKIDKLLQAISLDQWSKGFLESVRAQAQKNGKLSEKQLDILNRIEDENSQETQNKHKQWVESYKGSEKEEIAKICANFYATDGQYYQRLAYMVLEDEDFVPSEREWKKLCENKYAQRVIKATFDEPLYKEGSLVSTRSSAPWKVKNASSNNIFMVLKANAKPVVTACKGAKVYKIVPVGSLDSFLLEERHIKKIKKVE